MHAGKNGTTDRKIESWVIPPEADGGFVAAMENVPDTYAMPYGPQVPGLCMDGQPVQLLEETRVPLAATKDHAKRVGYEYGRAGVRWLFADDGRRSIGRSGWPGCRKGVTRGATRWSWCAAT